MYVDLATKMFVTVKPTQILQQITFIVCMLVQAYDTF